MGHATSDYAILLLMPLYSYTAINRVGKKFSSEKIAKDKEELKNSLKEDGLLVVDASEDIGTGTKDAWMRVTTLFENLRGVSLFERLVFTKNLSVMIHAGLPLTRALSAIGEETKSENFRNVITRIMEDVVKGKPFSEALSRYNKIFGDFFVSMVQAGEASGKLDRIMLLLARQIKKDYDLRSRVRGAMLYPVIILSILFVIGVLMMMYVVPTLAQSLTDLNVELPLSTRLIIGLSNVFVEYALFVFLGIALLIFLFVRFIHSAFGKPLWDRFALHIPLFGNLIRKMNVARITRVLSYLLASGTPIIRSLEIARDVVGSARYKISLSELSEEIAQGKTMGSFFHAHGDLYDPLVAEMVSAGEETGKTSELLLDIAIFFEQDITETTKNLSSIIEPFLMVFIGGAVGFFAISVMQPIYSSLGNI